MTETAHRHSDATPDVDQPGTDRFAVHRPPRSYPRPVPTDEVVLAPPPARPEGIAGWPASLLPLLGSAGSLLLLGATGPRRRWLVLVIVASLLLSLGAGLVPPLRRRRAARRARARYLDHLGAAARTLDRVAAVQRDAAEHLYPDLPAILALVGVGERLWERRPVDEDFLSVRVGRGPAPLAAPVRLDHGPDPLAEREPGLLAAADDLLRRASRLEALPLVVPLRRAGVLAVTGPPSPARALARFLLAQVAAFHAPEDLRILAAYPAADAQPWGWLKWLPHVRDRAGPGTVVPACLLATTGEQLSAHLEREVRPRLAGGARSARPAGAPASAGLSAAPPGAGPSAEPTGAHLLVVLDGFSPRGALWRLPLLDELLLRAVELDATVLCLVGRRADEPTELRARIELDGAGGMVLQETGPGATERWARADAADGVWCEAIARRLAPLRLAGRRDPGGARFAGPVRLLRLLEVGEPAAVDAAETWSRGSRSKTDLLRVPVGVRGARDRAARTANPLVLDLKEAAEGGMGPHGLLIGATGSGKSELLRTIVVGLAITHPPELLSFVLVDFKGGAAFAGLDTLPHTAGLITNLRADLAMVDRVEAALQGEQERRQRLLRQAGNLDGIAHYQARRAVDPGLEPLPYLLLVVDEFGELLAARPDFIELFNAIGRIGRSLGMHLLLASQRLDEGRVRGLESHLRYRICLRTFAAADSVAVLGTADAHTLPPYPGCGWLKVDSGAPQRFEGAVVTVAAASRGSPSTLSIVPFAPAPVATPGSPPPGPGPGPGFGPGHAGGDMDAVVAALSAAGTSGRRAGRVWLPPLAATITLDTVLARVPRRAGTEARPVTRGWLQVPVGVIDRPFEQVQEPFLLDLGGAGGHLAVVGAPRSGKSTLLATIAAALALTHAPDAVQLYCIDLGGGLLRQLAGLPHVGAVCGPHERDRARHLVRELRALVAARERGLRDRGVNPMPGPLERPHLQVDDRGYGEVLLLVDNWARLREELPDLEPEIEALAATGLQHGVHLVLTANRWADLRLALRDNLGGRLELRLNDPLESAVGRAAAAALPADTPGRGLTPAGLHFQTALPMVGAPIRHGGAQWLAAAAEQIARRAVRSPDGTVAPPLRMLPAVVVPSDLPASAEEPPGAPPGARQPGARQPGGAPLGGAPPGAVPLGLHEHGLAPVWLDLLSGPPHFLVLGDVECGKTSVLRCLAGGLSACHPPERVRLAVVDYRRTLTDLAGLPQCGVHSCTPAAATQAVARLRQVLDERLSLREPVSPRRGGPRHVLLVDDYHLVTGGGSSPLEPLLDLLALGRDVGLHVVLACAAGAAARAAFDPFLRRLNELGSPGLVMSGDPRDGPLLGGRAAVPLPPGRGLLIRRRAVDGLVQVVWTPPPVMTPGGTAEPPAAPATTLRSHPP